MSDPWTLLCKDRPCIACGAEDGTIVPAHRNETKGLGLKVHSALTVPLCLACHTALDNGPAPLSEKRADWNRWFVKHVAANAEGGLISVTSHTPRSTPAPKLAKVLPRREYSR